MNNQTIFWIWIQQLCGYGSKKISKIMQRYTFAEDFYKAPFEEKLMCLGGNTDALTFRDVSDKRLYNARKVIRHCRENNIEIVAPGDENYPKRLLLLPNPPAALYVSGDISLLNSELSISVVGTRNPSQYGEFMARGIASGLADEGFTIVSGGALGIDTVAHKSTLHNNGKTICVLGCGIGNNYLKENRKMREDIAREGALVSEYVPLTPTAPNSFKLRDRLISGLSDGVVVIEAGEISGTLVTANYATEQKKKLYALEKPDGSSVSKGSEKLINSMKAKAVCYYTEIVDDFREKFEELKSDDEKEIERLRREYLANAEAHAVHVINASEWIKPFKGIKNEPEYIQKLNKTKVPDKKKTDKTPKKATPKKGRENEEDLDYLSGNALIIYKHLTNEKIHIDVLALKTGMAVSDVSGALTELELLGLAQSHQGNMYTKK